MKDQSSQEKVEILSKEELGRTLARLASQIIENVSDTQEILLLGIPTRGEQLAKVLGKKLEEKNWSRS